MITVIIPYYRAPLMLRKQLDTVKAYPREYRVIVVDDGSPEPASDVFAPDDRPELYRIDVDIPWNRGQARNLGARLAETAWLIQIDTDHVLPVNSAERLLDTEMHEQRWYKFPRFRVGRADETRRKDRLPDDCEYGPIHPHMDSYLIPREMYLSSPYDERYSGCLGGGTPFQDRMRRINGPAQMLPDGVCLEVYTRHAIPDASVFTLDRDTSEYKRRRRAIGDKPPLVMEIGWEKVAV